MHTALANNCNLLAWKYFDLPIVLWWRFILSQANNSHGAFVKRTKNAIRRARCWCGNIYCILRVQLSLWWSLVSACAVRTSQHEHTLVVQYALFYFWSLDIFHSRSLYPLALKAIITHSNMWWNTCEQTSVAHSQRTADRWKCNNTAVNMNCK